MIRLVASDIDGTLLRNGAKTIDPVLFDQIRRLRERGIRFCPASGRQYSSLRRLFAPVADELSYLCENGAVVWGPGAPGAVLRRRQRQPSRTQTAAASTKQPAKPTAAASRQPSSRRKTSFWAGL